MGVDGGRRGGFHGVVDVGPATSGAVDDPGLSPDVADVLRLPGDGRYEWAKTCAERFGQVPSQVCHEFNTVAHLTDYEGRPLADR